MANFDILIHHVDILSGHETIHNGAIAIKDGYIQKIYTQDQLNSA